MNVQPTTEVTGGETSALGVPPLRTFEPPSGLGVTRDITEDGHSSDPDFQSVSGVRCEDTQRKTIVMAAATLDECSVRCIAESCSLYVARSKMGTNECVLHFQPCDLEPAMESTVYIYARHTTSNTPAHTAVGGRAMRTDPFPFGTKSKSKLKATQQGDKTRRRQDEDNDDHRVHSPPVESMSCPGDVVAELLWEHIQNVKTADDHNFHMGTADTNVDNMPTNCSRDVEDLFCQFNSEYRGGVQPSVKLHLQPTCPGPLHRKFTLDWGMAPAEKCKLLPDTNNTTSAGLRLGYVILAKSGAAHKVSRLLNAIDDKENLYVVHVDIKGGLAELAAVTAAVPTAMASRTAIISTRNVSWGGPSILFAYMDGIRKLHVLNEERVAKEGPDGGGDISYVINLSESCYPLMTQPQLRSFLATYGNYQNVSFLDFGIYSHAGPLPIPPWALEGAPVGEVNGIASELTEDLITAKVQRILGVVHECSSNGLVYPTYSLRRVPDAVDWREGSFWHLLHWSFVETLVGAKMDAALGNTFTTQSQTQTQPLDSSVSTSTSSSLLADAELAANLATFFSVASNPDETFFQTLAVNSRTGCPNICNHNLRYENWKVDENPDLMHPMPLTIEDVDRVMKDSNGRFAFARKFEHLKVYKHVDTLLGFKPPTLQPFMDDAFDANSRT